MSKDPIKNPVQTQSEPYYRITSGVTDDFGKSYHVVSTTDPQYSFGMYDNGRYVTRASQDLEYLGKGLDYKEPENNPTPAKLIHCERGNIHLCTNNGDIILEGRNVIIKAGRGGLPEDKGAVEITSAGEIYVKGTKVNIKGTEVNIMGFKTTNILGKNQANLMAANLAIKETSDLSIIGSLTKFFTGV